MHARMRACAEPLPGARTSIWRRSKSRCLACSAFLRIPEGGNRSGHLESGRGPCGATHSLEARPEIGAGARASALLGSARNNK